MKINDTTCIYDKIFKKIKNFRNLKFLQILAYERYLLKFFILKNISYFVQSSGIDQF